MSYEEIALTLAAHGTITICGETWGASREGRRLDSESTVQMGHLLEIDHDVILWMPDPNNSMGTAWYAAILGVVKARLTRDDIRDLTRT